MTHYPDLTGNCFDTENAQRRLWAMNPLLSKHNLPMIENLYNELGELLEMPMFFDKIAFSEKVDELFQLLEKMRND